MGIDRRGSTEVGTLWTTLFKFSLIKFFWLPSTFLRSALLFSLRTLLTAFLKGCRLRGMGVIDAWDTDLMLVIGGSLSSTLLFSFLRSMLLLEL